MAIMTPDGQLVSIEILEAEIYAYFEQHCPKCEHGHAHPSILIHDGRLQVGVLYQPCAQDTEFAINGDGSFYDDCHTTTRTYSLNIDADGDAVIRDIQKLQAFAVELKEKHEPGN